MNFYSLDGLSSRTNDMLNVYIIPVVNICIIIWYLISSLVLSSKNLKGDINRLLLVNSVTGVIMFILSNSLAIFRCGALCPWGYDYYSKAFEWFIYLFIGRSAEVFGIFTELNMLILKLRAFSSDARGNQSIVKKYDKTKFFLLIAIYWIISLVFYILPTFYGRSIVQIGFLVKNQTTNGNETKTVVQRPLFILYKDNSNDLINSLIQLFFPFILLLLYVLIMILNTIMAFKLKNFLKRKRNLISNSKLEKFLTE
jgi:hypothetical protein